MSKKVRNNTLPKGVGLAIGLAVGLAIAMTTRNEALFVIGVALGAGIESTYSKK